MLKSYFNIAVRVALSNKIVSIISILGLTFGFASCLLVALFVIDEFSYDKWINNAERIYKLETTYVPKDLSEFATSKTPYPALSAIKEKLPGVEYGVRILEWDNKVRRGGNIFYEQITYVEKDFFKIFDIPVVVGEREEVLSSASKILISETKAKKYFGNENPIGQSMTIDSFGSLIDYEVVGVFKDIPENTHFEMDMLAYFDDKRDVFQPILGNWYSARLHTYILKSRESFEKNSERVVGRLARGYISDDELDNVEDVRFNLIPMLDIHLHGDKERQRKRNGSIGILITFVFASILVLIVACINFVNLLTARATIRAKEVSLRKVMGSSRRQIAVQFIGETVIFSYLALVTGVLIAALALPWFNSILDKSLHISTLFSFENISLCFVFSTLVGVVAGIYPSIILSSFPPAYVLRANRSTAPTNSWVRQGLVILQFSVSTALIISSLMVFKQTSYMTEKDKGFDSTNKLNLFIGNNNRSVSNTIKQEMLSIEGVKGVAVSDGAFPRSGSGTVDAQISGKNLNNSLITEMMSVDEDFFTVYEIQEKSGVLFSSGSNGAFYVRKEGQRGQGDVVVNETFVKKIGFKNNEDAVGAFIDADGNDYKIIGVVSDLHIRSLRNSIRPIIFSLKQASEMSVITLDLDDQNNKITLDEIDAKWSEILPDTPIRRRFVEEKFRLLYVNERRQMSALVVFTLLSIIVAAIGLYGMSYFVVDKRNKEIAIRKILGASRLKIVKLLAFSFSKPVIVGSTVGSIVGYVVIDDWLNSFVFRLDLNNQLYLFILSIFFTAFIAMVTIFYQVRKVADSSPADVLRYE